MRLHNLRRKRDLLSYPRLDDASRSPRDTLRASSSSRSRSRGEPCPRQNQTLESCRRPFSLSFSSFGFWYRPFSCQSNGEEAKKKRDCWKETVSRTERKPVVLTMNQILTMSFTCFFSVFRRSTMNESWSKKRGMLRKQNLSGCTSSWNHIHGFPWPECPLWVSPPRCISRLSLPLSRQTSPHSSAKSIPRISIYHQKTKVKNKWKEKDDLLSNRNIWNQIKKDRRIKRGLRWCRSSCRSPLLVPSPNSPSRTRTFPWPHSHRSRTCTLQQKWIEF